MLQLKMALLLAAAMLALSLIHIWAEISKTKSCISSVIPKLCCGSWNGQKRSFGKSRPTHFLRR